MASGSLIKECWLDVPGFEGAYQVSDCGRVRSLDRHVAHAFTGTQFVPGQVMKATLDTKGYFRLVIKQSGRCEFWAVHRLVLRAFMPREDWREKHVNHKDGVRTNNRLENLEWCTPAENTMHAYRVIKTLKVPQPRHGAEHANARAVIGKCIDTGEIRRFAAVADTAAAGFKPSDVSSCCGGRQASHRGWLWRHDEGEPPADWCYSPKPPKRVTKPVERVSADGVVVRYESARAATADGFSYGSISHCITGRQRMHGGYVWRLSNA